LVRSNTLDSLIETLSRVGTFSDGDSVVVAPDSVVAAESVGFETGSVVATPSVVVAVSTGALLQPARTRTTQHSASFVLPVMFEIGVPYRS
jgi:hypothetical protein